jgi:hypothetical protein
VWYDLCWNGKLWVAVGNSNTVLNAIAYSYNGINWVGLGKSGVNGIFNSAGYVISWNGVEFLAGGDGTTGILSYSYDGINWTFISTPVAYNAIKNILWDGKRWIVYMWNSSIIRNTAIYSASKATGPWSIIYSSTTEEIRMNPIRNRKTLPNIGLPIYSSQYKMAIYQQSGSQSINSNVSAWTTLNAINSTPTFYHQDSSFVSWNSSVNQFDVNEPGVYRVSARLEYELNGTGMRAIRVYKNSLLSQPEFDKREALKDNTTVVDTQFVGVINYQTTALMDRIVIQTFQVTSPAVSLNVISVYVCIEKVA